MFSGYTLDTLPQSESSLVIATSMVPVNSATNAVPMQPSGASYSPGMSPDANTSATSGGDVEALGPRPPLPSVPPPRVDVSANEAAVDVGEVVTLDVSDDAEKGHVNPVASLETGERSAPLPSLPTSAASRSGKGVDQLDHKF